MRALVIFTAAALCASVSFANAASTRIRGTIAAVNGDVLGINSRDGRKITLKLVPNYAVTLVEKASLSDVKINDYVGATTVPGKNGSLIALGVHIFPPAARGRGEGSRPNGVAPNSVMTNAPVTGDVKSEDGRKLTLTYKGGHKTFLVTPQTVITRHESGTHVDVRPGADIVVSHANKQPDGVFTAALIDIGPNGVRSPE